jgi:hypothetical protein
MVNIQSNTKGKKIKKFNILLEAEGIIPFSELDKITLTSVTWN